MSSFIAMMILEAKSLFRVSNYLESSIVSLRNYLLTNFYSWLKLFFKRGPENVFCFSKSNFIAVFQILKYGKNPVYVASSC